MPGGQPAEALWETSPTARRKTVSYSNLNADDGARRGILEGSRAQSSAANRSWGEPGGLDPDVEGGEADSGLTPRLKEDIISSPSRLTFSWDFARRGRQSSNRVAELETRVQELEGIRNELRQVVESQSPIMAAAEYLKASVQDMMSVSTPMGSPLPMVDPQLSAQSQGGARSPSGTQGRLFLGSDSPRGNPRVGWPEGLVSPSKGGSSDLLKQLGMVSAQNNLLKAAHSNSSLHGKVLEGGSPRNGNGGFPQKGMGGLLQKPTGANNPVFQNYVEPGNSTPILGGITPKISTPFFFNRGPGFRTPSTRPGTIASKGGGTQTMDLSLFEAEGGIIDESPEDASYLDEAPVDGFGAPVTLESMLADIVEDSKFTAVQLWLIEGEDPALARRAATAEPVVDEASKPKSSSSSPGKLARMNGAESPLSVKMKGKLSKQPTATPPPAMARIGTLQRMGTVLKNMQADLTVDARTAVFSGRGMLRPPPDMEPGYVAKLWNKVETHANRTTYKQGMGLVGRSWLRGGKAIDWNVLKHLEDDPEHFCDGYEESLMPLFSGAACVPLVSEETGSVIGVMVCLLSRSIDNPAEYMDNTYLHQYLLSTGRAVQAQLRAETARKECEEARTDFKQRKSTAARKRWKKAAFFAKTGLLKRSSDVVEQQEKGPVTPSDLALWFSAYMKKWAGLHARPPPRVDLATSMFVFMGCFISLAALSLIHKFGSEFQGKEYPFFLGSFGALSSLVFGAPQSPYAQPRMVIASHLIAVTLAVLMDYITDNPDVPFSTPILPQWLSNALVPSLSITVLAIVGFTHPPAAACAIIYIADQQGAIKAQGWLFVLIPSVAGCCLIIFFGLVINNLSPARTYPLFW